MGYPRRGNPRRIIQRRRWTPPRAAGPRTFYVSAAGSDSNDGTSTGTPWLTIGKVNSTTLQPGDQVLFRGGDTFTDTLLYLTVSGSAASPIRIGSYGTGRATISVSGQNAIYAYNCAGIEVRDLICTAAGTPGGAGVQFYSDGTGGRRDHLLIDNVTATGYVNGISIGSGTTTAGYGNVTVSNCSLSTNRDNGLIVFGPSYNVATPTYAVQTLAVTAVDAFSNAGNSANTTSASGFGINVGSVDTGTITGCRAYSNGTANGGTTVGPVGIMVYDSRTVTVHGCLAYSNRNGTTPTVDGEGIDLDINCIDCTVQYSLAYDNDGAGILDFASSSNNAHTGSVIRYNLCWGNGRETGAADYWGEIKVDGNVANAEIYGNTLVARDTASTQPVPLNIGGAPTGIKVRNNIFYAHTGPSVIGTSAWTTSQVLMQGNDYYRSAGTSIKWGATTYSTLASWRAAVTGQEQVSGGDVGLTSDPLLNAPATSPGVTTIAGMLTYTGLALGAGSPAAAAGLDLNTLFGLNPGTRDYWGDPLTVPLSIGADESDAVAPSTGSAAGTITWAGTSAGKRTSKGTASGAITWTGTAAGKRVAKSAAAGVVTWAGTSAGKRAPKGAASGTVTWAGTAQGQRSPKAAASGAVTWAGSAQGKRTPKGSAAGTVTWVGESVGSEPARGSASGAITWGGSAAGTTVRSGAAVGAVTWGGTAAGARPSLGSAAGAVAWAGTAVGKRHPAGAAGGAVAWAGSAAGVRHAEGSAAGAVEWAGTATGRAPTVGEAAGSAAGAITWAGTAAGRSPNRGSASGAITWAGTGAGRRNPKASATGAVAWAGTAAGARPSVPTATGAAAGSIAWAGSAVGKRRPVGAGVGAVAWAGTAVGLRRPKGAAVGAVTWAGTAVGDRPAGAYPLVLNPRLTVAPNRARLTVTANMTGLAVRPNLAELEFR